jgi:toxin ParE1/3/4
VSSLEVIVRHEAELDALAYFEFITNDNPAAGLRLLAAIDESIQFLAQHPFIGRLRNFRDPNLAGIRSWRVSGFGSYLIFYRSTDAQVDVLRIRHGAMSFPDALLKQDDQ